MYGKGPSAESLRLPRTIEGSPQHLDQLNCLSIGRLEVDLVTLPLEETIVDCRAHIPVTDPEEAARPVTLLLEHEKMVLDCPGAATLSALHPLTKLEQLHLDPPNPGVLAIDEPVALGIRPAWDFHLDHHADGVSTDLENRILAGRCYEELGAE